MFARVVGALLDLSMGVNGEDCGIWGTRTNTPTSVQNIKVGSWRAEFDDRLRIDHKRDIIVNKRMASAFFETHLGSLFNFHRIDTVIVTGGSTSGCVRATVVDAFSYNFRVAMVEEGCFDRSQASHAMTLCDLGAKYADIVKAHEVLAYFDTLPKGLFDLPKGVPA